MKVMRNKGNRRRRQPRDWSVALRRTARFADAFHPLRRSCLRQQAKRLDGMHREDGVVAHLT